MKQPSRRMMFLLVLVVVGTLTFFGFVFMMRQHLEHSAPQVPSPQPVGALVWDGPVVG